MNQSRNNKLIAALDEKTLLLVTGKGGVGKTTITSNLCLRYLKRRQKVLRLDIELPHFKENFQHIHSLFSEAQASGKYAWMNLTSRACFEEYLENKKFLSWLSDRVPAYLLRSSFLRNRFFDSRVVDLFLTSAPGFREIVIMGKIYSEARSGNWDKVIVDLPASGHALDFIRVPFVSGSMFASGFAGEESKKIADYLTSHQTTSVVTVTISEEMAISETIETLEKLKDFGVSSPLVLFNRYPGQVPSARLVSEYIEKNGLGDYRSIIDEVTAFERERFNRSANDFSAVSERLQGISAGVATMPTSEVPVRPGQEIILDEIVNE